MSNEEKDKKLDIILDEIGESAGATLTLDMIKKAYERLISTPNHTPFIYVDNPFSKTPDDILEEDPERYYKMRDEMIKESKLYTPPKEEQKMYYNDWEEVD